MDWLLDTTVVARTTEAVPPVDGTRRVGRCGETGKSVRRCAVSNMSCAWVSLAHWERRDRKSLRASSTGWRAIVWSVSSTPARRCSALLCCLRLASRSTAFAAGQSKPKRYGRASRYQGACQAAYAMRYVLEQTVLLTTHSWHVLRVQQRHAPSHAEGL